MSCANKTFQMSGSVCRRHKLPRLGRAHPLHGFVKIGTNLPRVRVSISGEQRKGLVNQMFNLLKNPVRVAGMVFATSLVAAAQGGFAQPGTVNYVEGQVNLDGQSITANKIGSTVVAPGHVLQTGNGKAEMLLTPGVFVRLGDRSAIKMILPSLTSTQFELTQGQTMVEVAGFEKAYRIEVTVGGSVTTLKTNGIYEFSANPPSAKVYDGKAVVEMGEHSRTLDKGDKVALDPSNAKLKTQDFDLKKTEMADDLYAWSRIRADYMAQANMSSAGIYEGGGSGWYGPGWYWNPYFNQYAFLLGDGFLWDPFGFGFFSPGYWGMYAPYFGYGRFGSGFAHGAIAGGAITRTSTAGAALSAGRPGGGGISSMRASGGFGGGMAGGFGGMRGGGGGGRR
jgi:hypothetical protein